MKVGDTIKIEDTLYRVNSAFPLVIAPLTNAPNNYDYELNVAPSERWPGSDVFWDGNEKVAEIYGKSSIEFNCNCGLNAMTKETALAFAKWITEKLK